VGTQPAVSQQRESDTAGVTTVKAKSATTQRRLRAHQQPLSVDTPGRLSMVPTSAVALRPLVLRIAGVETRTANSATAQQPVNTPQPQCRVDSPSRTFRSDGVGVPASQCVDSLLTASSIAGASTTSDKLATQAQQISSSPLK